MSREELTPENVVAAYRKWGVTPCRGTMGVGQGEDGTWISYADKYPDELFNRHCCAAGIMMIGRPVRSDDHTEDFMDEFGVAYVPFYEGFDNIGTSDLTHPDYLLGKSIRAAVVAELGEF